MCLIFMRDLKSEYGNDACGAATFSRQLTRTDKPVDVTALLFRTGVQFPPSPNIPKQKKALTCLNHFNRSGLFYAVISCFYFIYLPFFTYASLKPNALNLCNTVPYSSILKGPIITTLMSPRFSTTTGYFLPYLL